MCGRFAMPWDAEQLELMLDAEGDDDWEARPSWNIAPGSEITTLGMDGDGTRRLATATWNLVPSWSATDRLPYPTFNARIETAADKPTFRDAAASGRILVPMLGYYEWDASHRPHWFQGRDGGPLLAAGLCSVWRGRRTATILTRDAIGMCARVHDRMPVLFDAADAAPWLTWTGDPHTLLRAACKRGAQLSGRLAEHEVAPLRGDGPRLIEPRMVQAPLL